jgi:predicted RNA methylase
MLETAGGKYTKNAFLFKGKDAQEIKDRLLDGEKVNDKKKYQFFATPQKVVDRVIELAEIADHHSVLEPSAGTGNMVDGLPTDQVVCCELWEDNVKVLQDKGYSVLAGDFTKAMFNEEFDRIVANPPFTNNQDIDHVRLMYKALVPGGRLVSVMSTSWRHGTKRKQRDFREWLDHVEAKVEPVHAGAFKESGTNIETYIVTIDKRA